MKKRIIIVLMVSILAQSTPIAQSNSVLSPDISAKPGLPGGRRGGGSR